MPGSGSVSAVASPMQDPPVCVRADAARSGWSRVAGRSTGEFCPRAAALTGGHPSSTWENPTSWMSSSTSCTGTLDAAFIDGAVWRAGSPGQERDSPLSLRRAGPAAPGTDYSPQHAPRPAASTAPRYWPPRGRRQWGAAVLAGAARAEALPAAAAGEGSGEHRRPRAAWAAAPAATAAGGCPSGWTSGSKSGCCRASG